MAETESLSTKLAAWGQVASALVGVVAAYAAWAVGKQSLDLAQRQTDYAKTVQTLQFFATLSGQDMLTIRRGLNNEDWCVRYGYRQKATYAPEVSDEQIFAVVDFFDAVDNSCNQNLCNPTFTETLFGPYAQAFYPQISQFIVDAHRHGRGASFGLGMAHLAHVRNPVDQVAAEYRTAECPTAAPPAGAQPG